MLWHAAGVWQRVSDRNGLSSSAAKGGQRKLAPRKAAARPSKVYQNSHAPRAMNAAVSTIRTMIVSSAALIRW
jgi:hypothetical protein